MIENREVSNIMIAGVGGQGSILTSQLLTQAALLDGKEVKLAETFGAATRGGSVLTHIRIGQAWAPLMSEDEADALVALEPLEGLRVGVTYLKPGGWVIMNTRPWYPVDVSVGRAVYPPIDEIISGLQRLGGKVLTLDATDLAMQAGDTRATNTVLLGGLFALDAAGISEENLFKAMENRWAGKSAKLVKLNQEAYSLGKTTVLDRLKVQ